MMLSIFNEFYLKIHKNSLVTRQSEQFSLPRAPRMLTQVQKKLRRKLLKRNEKKKELFLY